MHRAKRSQRGGALLAAVLACSLVLLGACPATAATRVRLRASVDGRDLRSVDANDPLKLFPNRPAVVNVRVTNDSGRELAVRSVRLSGTAMGLTFFSYETRVDMRVRPNGTDERKFTLDLVDLEGQATGLLPSELALLDNDRITVASESFTSDVRGSLRSVYGVFGILVALITALLLAGALIRLATHRLSANRWSRAARFGIPGVGLGLTLTFSFSALRIFSPDRGKWLTLVVAFGIGMFLAGYLTPRPHVGDEELEEEEEDEAVPTTIDLTERGMAGADAAKRPAVTIIEREDQGRPSGR